MPLLLVVLSFSSMGSGASVLIVEVEVARPPSEFLRGPKWVSLNSATVLVSRTVKWICSPYF